MDDFGDTEGAGLLRRGAVDFMPAKFEIRVDAVQRLQVHSDIAAKLDDRADIRRRSEDTRKKRHVGRNDVLALIPVDIRIAERAGPEFSARS